MNQEPIFLSPVFQERIWGGSALREVFHYDIQSPKTGECWSISAHPNGPSVVANGLYKGKTLQQLWEEERHLFGNHDSEKFPLLTKILDANDDLSVQVHPNDEYANEHENGEYGKTECWYIIDCDQDAELIFGHNARSKEQLHEMIESGNWDAFLRRVRIQPGDFFYVPSGTVHALGKGTLVLETQQSSDTTYRVYDYDRMENGSKRELHLEKAMDVITVPFDDIKLTPVKKVQEETVLTYFVENEFFTVAKWEVNGRGVFTQNQKFMLFSVIQGEGIFEKEGAHYSIQKGSHFILPYKFGEFSLEGNMEVIVSHL
ncbi:mannose-6-phosphate isomerase, class I [Ectobacillus funiculus]|uniref:Mannose-6-phosphate isomerase n=1 Tax=Ectobacillus funiculus TaxID=137993 RepID=A0ABV5WAZ2_9BACI